MIEPLGTKSRRRQILRSVYEDNLKMASKPAPPERSSRRIRWGANVVLALTGLLVMLGGVLVFRELQADAPASKVPVAAADGETSIGPADGPEDRISEPARLGDTKRLGDGVVPLASLFGLEVKTIVIDPGHGGRDPGAVGPNGLKEKDVTLDVAHRLKRRLERHGYRILMTREADVKVSLQERVEFANAQRADLFISIHVNSLPVEPVTSVETYYFGLEADEQTLRLAARENRDSDYSNSDFREVLEKVGTTMKFQESKELAGSIQSSLYRNMRKVNGQVSNWGVKPGPFVVLLGVKAPSVLAEISVISNEAEARNLRTPEHRERLAASLEAGIVNYLREQLDSSESTVGAIEHGSQEDE